jgi:antitoxin (DNA-binding transcriptional repressor) of toxin-antitoxin stability system
MDRGKGDSTLKTVSLDSPQFTLEALLREAAAGEVVFLTTDGLPRFALVAVDEGDQEAFSLRSNSDFMAYLDECKQRARRGPAKSLEEIKRLFSDDESLSEPRTNEPARTEENSE